MNGSPKRFVPILVICLLCGACTPKRPEATESQGVPADVLWSNNGWTEAERAEYHHLPEGSELMPYVLLANVVSVKTGRPFVQDLDRFGFLLDPKRSTNPRGLPIGLTTVRSRDKSLTGLEMLGFNCAACHVGEMHYRGKRLRIDGAPSLV